MLECYACLQRRLVSADMDAEVPTTTYHIDALQ